MVLTLRTEVSNLRAEHTRLQRERDQDLASSAHKAATLEADLARLRDQFAKGKADFNAAQSEQKKLAFVRLVPI